MTERLFNVSTQVNLNFTMDLPNATVNFSLPSEHIDLKPTGTISSFDPRLNKSADVRNIELHKGNHHHHPIKSELIEGETFVVFQRKKHDNKDAVTTVSVIAVVFIFTILVGIVYHKRQSSYQSIVLNSSSYDYIYKPLKRGILDDEYESTFVGVDVPLLQEVSVI